MTFLILIIFVSLSQIRYIDRGCNPQLYTRDCLEKTLHKNEQVKGKIDALKKLKANLLTELSRSKSNLKPVRICSTI